MIEIVKELSRRVEIKEEATVTSPYGFKGEATVSGNKLESIGHLTVTKHGRGSIGNISGSMQMPNLCVPVADLKDAAEAYTSFIERLSQTLSADNAEEGGEA